MKDDFIKFFSEMRKADEKEELPSFEAMMPKPKVTSINYDLQSGPVYFWRVLISK
jgi:hypothetical protein